MAFTRMAFSPEDGLNNKEAYPTTPDSEEEARAQVQSVSDQLKAYLNGTLIAELESAEAGQSGADRIGSAAIAYVAGDTVRAQIADIKRQIDDVSAGTLPDGTITANKLADGAVTKGKLHQNALCWTLVYEGALGVSGGFAITPLTGSGEIMIQLRDESASAVTGFAVLPLGNDGMMTPPAARVIGCDPNTGNMDYRVFTMVSGTMMAYGMSRAESTGGVTNLKRAYVFVR